MSWGRRGKKGWGGQRGRGRQDFHSEAAWKVFAELGNRLGGMILVVAFPVPFLRAVPGVTSPPRVSDWSWGGKLWGCLLWIVCPKMCFTYQFWLTKVLKQEFSEWHNNHNMGNDEKIPHSTPKEGLGRRPGAEQCRALGSDLGGCGRSLKDRSSTGRFRMSPHLNHGNAVPWHCVC